MASSETLGRWCAFFVLLWIGGGVYLAVRSRPGEASRDAAQAPWLQRPDWAAGFVENHLSGRAKFFLWLGVLMIAMLLPALPHAVAWVFVLIGVALTFSAARTLLTQSPSVLKLRTVPLRRGGMLQADWHPGQALPWSGLEVELQVKARGLASRQERSGEQILFCRRIELTAAPEASHIRIEIPLPGELPPSTGHDARSAGSVTWELTVYRDGKESAWFTLPVFDAAGAVAAPAVLRFPAGPRHRLLWPAAACAVVCVLAGYLDWFPASLFAGIFAVALIAPVLETATEVKVHSGWLTVRISMAGLWKVKKQIGLSEIAAVAAEASGGSLYDVEVRTVYGRTWTLVRDQDEAMAREGVKLIERARVQ